MEDSSFGPVYCTGCGQRNPPGSRFCAACGNELTAVETRTALTPPEDLRERARAAAIEAAGQRKQATVLFADVAGSMDLAERIDAEQWREVVDGLFKLLADAVHRHEGTVDKFTGDGIMALFGAPIADEEHARSACLAALEMLEQSSAYGERVDADLGILPAVRIGINSGTLVIGSLGEHDDLQYTAIGHTVGLAQRMESLATPGSILISERTAGLVRGYIDLEDRGPVDVKGATAPVETFVPIGVGAARDRLDVARERGLTPLAGRDAELAELEATLVRAEEGDGCVIGIVGSAGVGKSRICHELADLCRSRGIPVYAARCEAHGRDLPLMPVLQMLRGYFAIEDGDAPGPARAKVEERLLALDRSFGPDLALVWDFLGIGEPGQRPQMSGEARERRLNDLVRRIILARGRLGATLLLIEDLHWIDPASDQFLATLVAAVPGTRTLVVVNMRPEYRATWMASSSYRQLPLRGLGRAAFGDFIETLLGSDPSLAGLATLIGIRTGGNPFFVEEVVRELDERGALSGARGGYRLAGEVDELLVPATVQSVLAARIDRLPDASRAALHAAAVIGPDFTAEVLDRVAGDEDGAVEEALRDLVTAELVRETAAHPRREFSFVHPLTRQVALETQLLSERRHLHRAAAAALEEAEKDHLDESAAAIAEHLEAGECWLEAAGWRARAATWAGPIAPGASREQWEAVGELDGRIGDGAPADELRMAWRLNVINHSWRLGGDIERLRRLYREARAIAERRAERGALALLHSMLGLAEVTMTGNLAEFQRLTALTLELEDRVEDVGARVSALVGTVYPDYLSGQFEVGLAKLERILTLTESEPDAGAGLVLGHPRAWAISFRGWYLGSLGRFEEARAALDEGIEACERLDPESLIWAYSCSGALVYLGERPVDDEALADAGHAAELAAEIGDVFSRNVALTWLASLLRRAGEPERAIRVATEAIELVADRGVGVELDPFCRISLADSYTALGRIDDAIDAADGALRTLQRFGISNTRPAASIALAEALLGRGDDEAAVRAAEVIDGGVREARRMGMRPMLIEALRTRAAVCAAGGDDEGRREAIAAAIAGARSINAIGALKRLDAEPAVGS